MSPPLVAGIVCAVAAYGYFALASVVLAVVDVRTHRLPDRLVLPGYGVAAVLLPASALLAADPGRLVGVVAGAAGMFAFYLLLRLMGPAAMGGGDVKLAGVTGAFLGFLGGEVVLLGALAGFVLGGLFGLGLLVLRRARRGSAIAFGPWMLAGAWCAIATALTPLAG